MSRTDKDRPWWVVARERNLIAHNHTTGECRIEGPYRAPGGGGFWRWRHWNTCAKRVETTWFCTKDNPHADRYRRTSCWTIVWHLDDPDERRYNADGARLFVERRPCRGHRTVTLDETVPCWCDTLSPSPTCVYDWPADGPSQYRHSATAQDRATYYHRPQRRESRDALHNLAREYNAHGEVDDADPPARQARHGVAWLMD